MGGKTLAFGRFKRLLLALSAVAMALALLETSIWLVHTVIGGKPRLLRSDAELGWANRRNFTGTRRLGDGSTWRVVLDASGHRTLDLEQIPDAPQIVALGDSFVFGDGVDTESHFLASVGRRLPANVINLGVVGYSTDQEWLAFRRFRDDANVVLLGTYLSNDLSGNLSHSGGHLLRFKPKFPGCGTGGTPRQPTALRHPLLNGARHRSHLVTLSLRGMYRLAPGLSMFDTPEPEDETAGKGPAWDCYEALVDRIVDEAERRDARRVVILLWSFHSSRPDPEAAPLLAAHFAGRAVRVIDIDRAIADRGVDPRDFYHPPSVDPGAHWNAAGHAFVADLVLKALESSVE